MESGQKQNVEAAWSSYKNYSAKGHTNVHANRKYERESLVE